jgi:hypothetical protein
MTIENIWIVVATIVFTLSAFSYPVSAPYYWGFRGFSIILAIVGWILIILNLFLRQ